MKLQVPLRMAARLWTWLAASPTPERLDDRECRRRRSPRTRPPGPRPGPGRRSRGPCSASRALLAVTTCLPAARQSSTIRQGRLDAAHRLDHDLDFGILDQPGDLGRDPNALERDVPRLLGIADDGPLPADALARPAGDPVGMLGQDPGHARPHGAQPDQSDRDLFHVLRRTIRRPRG